VKEKANGINRKKNHVVNDNVLCHALSLCF